MQKIIIGTFFLTIFVLAIKPLDDFDLWFHLKSGEIFLKHGLIRQDLFSYSAQGREWFPYEWLFQVGLFGFGRLFGLEAIKFLVAALVSLACAIIFLFSRRIFRAPLISSILVSAFFFLSIYEFVSARPHLPAYLLLLTNLYLILIYYLRNKNYLLLSIPVTLVWANLHGSVFLGVALFGGYALTGLLQFLILKDRLYLKKAKTLFLFTILTAVLTVFPPLGLLQYRLLWIFFTHNSTLSLFISEWQPPFTQPLAFLIFSLTVFCLLSIAGWLLIRRKIIRTNLWILPLLSFIPLAYLATRNVFLANITLTLLLGWTLSQINFRKSRLVTKASLIILLLVASTVFGWQFADKITTNRQYYPTQAVKFLSSHPVKGNMFNEYGYGGYLLYHLYPAYKVFFDGRTDVYLCCEIPDFMTLLGNRNLPDDEFLLSLDRLFEKYKIAYLVISPRKYSIYRKISRILLAQPNWSLVFWDDNTQIFVRKDGQNDPLIAQFGAVAATPYNPSPFLQGKQELALIEYQRMLQYADSAKSRNAIGYILLQQGQLIEARPYFEQAVTLDPTFESPYMNLAELSAHQGNLPKAIELYQKARQLAPDRGFIYLRLGDLFFKANDPEKARTTWQSGFKAVQGDIQTIEALQDRLSKLADR